jgi:N-acylneuraminate cytidylyltransferase
MNNTTINNQENLSIAIIPARSGSKRIKNKNIKFFFGHPIIKYPIYEAKLTKLFKEIIVSTDSLKIKKIALKYGASVPFLRSKNLSDDLTPIYKVLLNTLAFIKKKETLPKYFCLIYATAYSISKNDIIKSYKILKRNRKSEAICSVCKYYLPVQRAFKINNKNFLEYINPKYCLKRSQDLDEAYYDSAQFVWFNTRSFLKKKGRNLKILPFVLCSDKIQDIDNLHDWKLAKKKYKYI